MVVLDPSLRTPHFTFSRRSEERRAKAKGDAADRHWHARRVDRPCERIEEKNKEMSSSSAGQSANGAEENLGGGPVQNKVLTGWARRRRRGWVPGLECGDQLDTSRRGAMETNTVPRNNGLRDPVTVTVTLSKLLARRASGRRGAASPLTDDCVRREFLGVLGAPQRFASFEGIFASGAAVTT